MKLMILILISAFINCDCYPGILLTRPSSTVNNVFIKKHLLIRAQELDERLASDMEKLIHDKKRLFAQALQIERQKVYRLIKELVETDTGPEALSLLENEIRLVENRLTKLLNFLEIEPVYITSTEETVLADAIILDEWISEEIDKLEEYEGEEKDRAKLIQYALENGQVKLVELTQKLLEINNENELAKIDDILKEIEISVAETLKLLKFKPITVEINNPANYLTSDITQLPRHENLTTKTSRHITKSSTRSGEKINFTGSSSIVLVQTSNQIFNSKQQLIDKGRILLTNLDHVEIELRKHYSENLDELIKLDELEARLRLLLAQLEDSQTAMSTEILENQLDKVENAIETELASLDYLVNHEKNTTILPVFVRIQKLDKKFEDEIEYLIEHDMDYLAIALQEEKAGKLSNFTLELNNVRNDKDKLEYKLSNFEESVSNEVNFLQNENIESLLEENQLLSDTTQLKQLTDEEIKKLEQTEGSGRDEAIVIAHRLQNQELQLIETSHLLVQSQSRQDVDRVEADLKSISTDLKEALKHIQNDNPTVTPILLLSSTKAASIPITIEELKERATNLESRLENLIHKLEANPLPEQVNITELVVFDDELKALVSDLRLPVHIIPIEITEQTLEHLENRVEIEMSRVQTLIEKRSIATTQIAYSSSTAALSTAPPATATSSQSTALPSTTSAGISTIGKLYNDSISTSLVQISTSAPVVSHSTDTTIIITSTPILEVSTYISTLIEQTSTNMSLSYREQLLYRVEQLLNNSTKVLNKLILEEKISLTIDLNIDIKNVTNIVEKYRNTDENGTINSLESQLISAETHLATELATVLTEANSIDELLATAQSLKQRIEQSFKIVDNNSSIYTELTEESKKLDMLIDDLKLILQINGDYRDLKQNLIEHEQKINTILQLVTVTRKY